jgi:uncharacterized membrane protein
MDKKAAGKVVLAATLACAFMWTLYTVAIKVSFKQTDSRIGFSIMSICTVAGLCVLALVFDAPAQSF